MTPKPLYFIGLLSLLVLPARAAQEPTADAEPREIRAVRLAAPPVIDGVLNDAAWQSPPLPLGTWLTNNPMFGERLPQQTEVWVAYDREYLY
ncbi:MAG: hypothetical protein EHM67_14340, partial [Hyphomicrobiaceae bacterium]